VRYWSRLSPFPSAVEPPWYDRWLDRFSLTQRLRDRVVAYYTEKINAQDTGVCEKLQTIARQNGVAPILGRLEERIGWFEDAYEAAMKPPASRVVSPAERTPSAAE
jgi:hypothetical protein